MIIRTVFFNFFLVQLLIELAKKVFFKILYTKKKKIYLQFKKYALLLLNFNSVLLTHYI